MTSPHIQAVIFDIGGVVLRSPFIAIATYERQLGIPENYLNCSIVGHGSQGAWQKFERGEMPLFEFYEAFGRELSDTVKGNVWYKDHCARKGLEVPRLPETLNVDGRELFGSMMRESNFYDQHILLAIHRIRAAGRYKIIALTNNFAKAEVSPAEAHFLGWDEGATPDHLRSLFDDFCDSSTLGMRKPEPEFYLLAYRDQFEQNLHFLANDEHSIRVISSILRRKARSSSHKPISHSRHAKRNLKKMPAIRGPKILQEAWDDKKTVRQNYVALGLVHSLNPSAAGGVEPLEGKQDHIEESRIASSSQLEQPAQIPKGFGKIIRDEAGNVLRIELPEEVDEPPVENPQDMEMEGPDVERAVLGPWVTDLGGGEKLKLRGGDSKIVQGEHGNVFCPACIMDDFWDPSA
ncbi:hypothetical protein D9615_001649 [Tricholomella constricta]|uniref:HAD-like protein n=1 Tax=Tricholomella constricta TaxID=117010 RepID=A0A8H5HNU9_9AGAR|nr:hypothetical protein D9615_001649 [Tricholomella constricta]